MRAIAPPPHAKTLIVAESPTVEPLVATTYPMASHLSEPPHWGRLAETGEGGGGGGGGGGGYGLISSPLFLPPTSPQEKYIGIAIIANILQYFVNFIANLSFYLFLFIGKLG